MPIYNIKKTKIRDAVYQQMVDMISSGEWKQNEKIPSENQLTQLFGVSRITIREVIQKLVSLGILESQQGGGTYVCSLDGSQYINNMIPYMVLGNNTTKNLLEFRVAIEGGSAYFAALRADEKDIEILRDSITRMQNSQSDTLERAVLDFDFHYAIAQSTKNPIIIRVYDILRDIWFESMQQIVATMGSERAVKYHTAILNAICDRDANRAAALMNEHIENTVQEMQPTEGE